METRDRLILALDVPDIDTARKLVRELQGIVTTFKIGSQLFTRAGPEVVEVVKQEGGRVFLDLKFHDIPNTVSRAVEAAISLSPFMLTLHASGGSEMLRQAARASREEAERRGVSRPLLLGVTVLTHLDEGTLNRELGIPGPVGDEVALLAGVAKVSGLDGVVSSPQEIEIVRRVTGEGFLIVTPGIRPEGAQSGDQKRTLTPGEALRKRADFLVVGRPISQASCPPEAALAILEEMERKE